MLISGTVRAVLRCEASSRVLSLQGPSRRNSTESLDQITPSPSHPSSGSGAPPEEDVTDKPTAACQQHAPPVRSSFAQRFKLLSCLSRSLQLPRESEGRRRAPQSWDLAQSPSSTSPRFLPAGLTFEGLSEQLTFREILSFERT